MTRLALVQLVVFAVVALACGYHVATSVLGPQAFQEPIQVTVRMPDTGGLSVGSQVTYRGVDVGEVSDVRIAGDGVEIAVSLDADSRIPADATAVVTMESPIAILRLDFRPRADSAPYLADGDVVTSGQTRRPLPLDTLLEDFLRLADSLPTEDLAVVGDALATGLRNASPELTRILGNTRVLLDLARDRTPQIERILDNARLLAGPDGVRIGELASAMRRLSGSLRDTEPALTTLLHEVPGPVRQVAELVRANEPALATLLGNLVTTGQLVSVRAPALEQLFLSLPHSLTKLGRIVEGDTANFYLVGTLGPVCYNDTPRRTPQQTEPRDPQLTWHCTPGEDLSQRGAMNAPRPAPATGTTYDATTGAAAPFQLGSTGGQATVLGPRSWSSMLLQGAQ